MASVEFMPAEAAAPKEEGFELVSPAGGAEMTAEDERLLRRVAGEREGTYANGFRQRAVLELALYSGAKLAELARLRVGDVLLQPTAPGLRIPSDSNPRVLPLSPEMVTALSGYLQRKREAGESVAPTAPLVCSQRGSVLSIRGWQAAWGLLQQHAGLVDGEAKPLFSLEAARHLVGRRVYSFAHNPHHVQAWLGLDVTTNADRYQPESFSVTTETLRALVDRVTAPPDLRRPHAPSLALATGYYNGTIGVMNRALARRLFLDMPPEDPLGQMWIARGLERGRSYFPINFPLADQIARRVLPAVREHAEAGDAMAVFLYASALDNGLGCVQDLEAATEWYHRAADLGSETGINNLALKYHWGRGCPQDDERAFDLFQRGAALHEANCMFNLGVLYSEGMGIDQDHAQAARWYQRAAGIGEVRSMNNLSCMLMSGEQLPKDEATALRWYCLSGQVPHATDNIVKPRPRIEMIRVAS